MQNLIVDNLTTNQDPIDLRADYPLAARVVIRRSWLWLVTYAVALYFTLFRYLDARVNPTSEGLFVELLNTVSVWVIFGGLLLCCGKLIYEVLYFITYEYGVDLGNLTVTEGVILKTRSSFPISKITDIYLDRDLIDTVFLLWDLNISTPQMKSAAFGKIFGLSRRSALELQDYLGSLLESVHPNTEIAVGQTPKEKPLHTESGINDSKSEAKNDAKVSTESEDH